MPPPRYLIHQNRPVQIGLIIYLSGSAVLDGDLDEGLARLLGLAAARLALALL